MDIIGIKPDPGDHVKFLEKVQFRVGAMQFQVNRNLYMKIEQFNILNPEHGSTVL